MKIKNQTMALMLCFFSSIQVCFAQQSTQIIERLAFGSCNKHDLPQPIWLPIINDSPDLFIWLGDNVYGDTDDMELLKSKYDAQNQQQDYKRLKLNTPVIGIWDDHDYGINDGGKFYAQKKESQQLMLDFLGEPASSPRRKQEGAYASYTYGVGENSIKILLLDARYHRDTLHVIDKVYQLNHEGTLLGEEQWKWLEEELKNSKASLNIIASGIQFIPTEHPHEKWANFPKERQRLLQLIATTKVKNPLLMSGDRHIAEISLLKNNNYPSGLYEVTSSGLTHTWKEYKEEYNPYRQGNLIAALHYGLLEIDWENRVLNIKIKGTEGQVFLEQQILFN
jgi:alkaline phosphatase D